MNEKFERPGLREIFFTAEKWLEVLFYTSNIPKYMQARSVFELYGLKVNHFKHHIEPYEEEYHKGKEELLVNAISQITSEIGASTVFFVEDTSLRIEAFSQGNEDYPGLAVKEWFVSNSFDDVNDKLNRKKRGRLAVVKSDIALHVPGLKKPIFFYGETKGKIAKTSPDFEASVEHPWLTPNTFNGWLIPNGSNKRLGEMTFEESLKFDFRTFAFIKLIHRVEEYTAFLNLPIHSYKRKPKQINTGQLPLSLDKQELLIVLGSTCAGKTTFGQYASLHRNFTWIEASSVVRMLRESDLQEKRMSNLQVYAESLLKNRGMDLIAKKVLELISNKTYSHIVITGFRTLEEIEFMKYNFPEVKIVLIEVSERNRFERYIKRGSRKKIRKLEDFVSIDQDQWKFGLLRVAEDFINYKIENEGTIAEYSNQIDAVLNDSGLSKIQSVSETIHAPRKDSRSQLIRSMKVLEIIEGALDCNQIQEKTGEFGSPIRFNNINKILKRYPELVQRIEAQGEKVRYQITDAGRTYLRLLKNDVVTKLNHKI